MLLGGAVLASHQTAKDSLTLIYSESFLTALIYLFFPSRLS